MTQKTHTPTLFFMHDQATALPLVMAVMGFLATLALIGGLALNTMARDWARGLQGTLTVEITAEALDAYKAEHGSALTPAVVTLLEAHPAIGAATPLTDEAMAALLAPWFPDAATVTALPLPQLIDVKLSHPDKMDVAALNTQLAALHPEIRADDYQALIAKQVRLARSLSWLAVGLIGLVGFATAMIISFATRTSFAAHRPTVDLVHLLGTDDKKVIGMFGRHFLIHTLSGGTFGMGIAALVAVLLARNTALGVDSLWAGLGTIGLCLVVGTPLIMAMLAHFMARREVRHQLAAMV